MRKYEGITVYSNRISDCYHPEYGYKKGNLFCKRAILDEWGNHPEIDLSLVEIDNNSGKVFVRGEEDKSYILYIINEYIDEGKNAVIAVQTRDTFRLGDNEQYAVRRKPDEHIGTFLQIDVKDGNWDYIIEQALPQIKKMPLNFFKAGNDDDFESISCEEFLDKVGDRWLGYCYNYV